METLHWSKRQQGTRRHVPANVAGVGDGHKLAVADLDGGVLSVRHAQVEVEAEHRNT